MTASLELAKSYYRRGFFHLAQPLLWNWVQSSEAVDLIQNNSVEDYLESVSLLLRICAEREDRESGKQLWNFLESQSALLLLLNQRSRFLYYRSLQSLYQGDLNQALIESQISLDLALQSGSHLDLAYALILKIKLDLSAQKNIVPENSNLENLRTLLQEIKDADLNLVYFLLEAEIAIAQQHLDSALSKIWLAYECAKMTGCGIFYTASTLAMLGYISVLRHEHDKALNYIRLAEKASIPESFIRLLRILKGLRAQCVTDLPEYDLFLDLKNRKLRISAEKELPLGNQFVIMKLLELLFKNPGRPFGKEDLAQLVWDKNYDPATHDNLIYVTLKRVRNMIEDDARGTSYLRRNKLGYYLNPDAKVGISEAEIS